MSLQVIAVTLGWSLGLVGGLLLVHYLPNLGPRWISLFTDAFVVLLAAVAGAAIFATPR